MAYDHQHQLRDGAVLVYKRSSAKRGVFQARIRIPGTHHYVVRSLKTLSLSEALRSAEDLYDELRFAHKNGLDITSPELRFKALWQKFYKAHQPHLSVHRQRLHEGNARRYFIPFLGDYKVSDTADVTFEKYWEWRINYYRNKEAAGEADLVPANAALTPAQKTLDMEAAMLRQIYRYGKRLGLVSREPWIKAPKVTHQKGTVRRPTFTVEEWEQIYTYMRTWAREGENEQVKGPHALHRYQRQVIRNYLLFMANSGLRPNEARQLKWRDVRIEKQENGADIVIVQVAPTTKTGERTVVCCEGTEYYLNRLRELSVRTNSDDLVFCHQNGEPLNDLNKSFMTLLTRLNLLTDSFGARRSVYSLRHFYCTQRILTEDIPLVILAKNMGTSVDYIQKHYAHVFTLQKAKELAFKRRTP